MSIIMKQSSIFGLAALALLSAAPVMAQKTMDDMQYLTINENVTTVITASEPVRFVDISTDKVAGDQPIRNIVRLKPKEGMEIHHDGDVLAVVTIITERYRSQYALIYTSRMDEAVTEKTITLDEREPYNNPAISMSTEDMTRYARQIWASPARVRNVSTKRDRMVMRLNSIYSVGEYFFIDFSVDNRTNIRFDIDQLRVKLNDKKTARSTTVQTIELIPELVLDPTRSFRYGYRNVIVLKKMTFPNDKMLTIELSEQQISGRTISLSIEYEDVLNADSFNNVLLMEN
ncbi:MAG: conjugative transposon protein TraN [Prevotella sp.]|nr:conjugative transposon protein TraN [Prevotella sp.]